MDYELAIRGGTIVDGTGKEAYPGDLYIQGGRIAAIIPRLTGGNHADNAEPPAGKTLDATGLTVCPGFIDMHSHADWIFPLEEHPTILAPLLEQGITTVIGGNCGFSPAPLAQGSAHLPLIQETSEFIYQRPLNLSWGTMDSFLDTLKAQGISLNLAMLSGHGTMRFSCLGRAHAYPGQEAMDSMERMVTQSFEEGSFGLSLGLGYEPGIFTEQAELEQLARCVQKYGRLLTVHNKAFSRLSGAYPFNIFDSEPHNLKALKEVLDLAERTGVRLQVSHLIFVGKKTWPTSDKALKMIDAAHSRGVDVAFDSFPYLCGNTTIYVVYPAWFLNNIDQNFKSPAALFRLRLEVALITKLLGFTLADIQVLWGGCPDADIYNGMFFGEIAREMKCSVLDAYLKVSRLGRGKTLCLLHKYSGDEEDESAYLKILRHPLNLVETDTILTARGIQNPASFGTFPRVIQRYHKELGILSLEEAIAKMTGYSARRFKIQERGTLKAGNWADITIFDYERIRDNTTSKELEAGPSGMRHVLINGQEALRDGKALPGLLAGQVIKAC